MLVYGDAVRNADPREEAAGLADRLAHLRRLPLDRVVRHAELVGVFVDAAELAQGLVDVAAEAGIAGLDDRVMAMLSEFARAVGRSWSGVPGADPLPSAGPLAALEGMDLPPTVACRRQEGYAFYALYPESYFDAAGALPAGSDIRVVGIRSIGIGLAAMVAARVGARVVTSVRPTGHPFARRLEWSGETRAALLEGAPDAVAIVDEGPGLSGSSFGSVADALEEAGLAARNIHFFPSHGGDLGPQASARHRARWRTARRHWVEFEAVAAGASGPGERLKAWVADLTGAASAPLVEVSGGVWREYRYPDEAMWPAANVQGERRKFLLTSDGGQVFLLKFAGLGRYGRAKWTRAQALTDAGWIPEVLGLRHGFLVERWRADARPLDVSAQDRTALVAWLAAYLAFRARRFPTEPESGASLGELAAMLGHNAREALGESVADGCAGIADELARLTGEVRRVATDNRLHPCEWMEAPDGRWLKADALDHCEAHDLVGCQDIAWDVAGAAVEFDLSGAETHDLAARIGWEADRRVHPRLVACLVPAYLAFQLGACHMAVAALGSWPEEQRRFSRQAARYARLLNERLAGAA